VRILELPQAEREFSEYVDLAVEFLGRGKPIIAPTETAYGLLADARNHQAVTRLFTIKQRPLSRPSAIFIQSVDQIREYAEKMTQSHLAALEILWPGPVTIVVKAKRKVWPGVVSTTGEIGLRCSSHPFIKAVLERFGHALTATSANLSGRTIASVAELAEVFAEQIELFIVDRDLDFNNMPSTVVRIGAEGIEILRQGQMADNMIERAFTHASG